MLEQILSKSNQNVTDSRSSLSKFWQDFKVVIQPYWYPTESEGRVFSEVIGSWGMLLLLILLIFAVVAMDGLGSFWNRYVIDIIIEERDLSQYYDTILISCILIVMITLLIGFSQFVRKRISLDWYKWLSNYILKRYLRHRAYYKLDFQSDLDNPDQRLAQEIEPITKGGFRFLATVLQKVLELTTFIIILATISQQVAIYLIIYTIAGNLIAIYLTQELNKISSEELEVKANYNYCLTHVRNHTESIAFFQGEDQELKIIERRFNHVVDNAERRIECERGQDVFNRAYQSAIGVFSMFILTPLFIQDQIDYGEIGQASMACLMFSNAVGILIAEWGNAGKLSSYVERLAKFSEMLQSIIKEPEKVTTITTIEDNHLAFKNVTLKTPNYEQVIVEDISLSVPLGEGLLIVGPSGRGKSSLLRAIAGLWDAGEGHLIRPSLEEMLFLPQRPYIILGTLREQLLYPQTSHQISNQELEIVLKQVNLGHILSRVDNLDMELPWENVLSLGEQQRLAFARILVNRPNFTILDEATSALDLKNEANLYQKLEQTGTTFISVGHRESLFHYHQWVLELLEDSRWQLLSMQAYKEQKNNLISGEKNKEKSEESVAIKQSQNNSSTIEKIEPKKTNESTENPPENNDTSTVTDGNKNSASSEKLSTSSLSHQQMQTLCNYSLGTIRNKGRKGQLIKAKDGFTYQYQKTLRKWLKKED